MYQPLVSEKESREAGIKVKFTLIELLGKPSQQDAQSPLLLQDQSAPVDTNSHLTMGAKSTTEELITKPKGQGEWVRIVYSFTLLKAQRKNWTPLLRSIPKMGESLFILKKRHSNTTLNQKNYYWLIRTSESIFDSSLVLKDG